MHDGALTLDDTRARSLIALSFPEHADAVLRRVGTLGTVNTLIRIDDVLVARFPFGATTPEELERESAAMSEFADVCPFPAPRPCGIGVATAEYPSAWSVQTWIPGYTASAGAQSAALGLAGDIADLVLALRRASTDDRAFDGQGRGGDLTRHDEWVAECLDRSAPLLDVGAASALWRRLRTLPSAGPDVMSHRDLTPYNILVAGDGAEARLAGVLDSASFGPADRALDLVAAWHLFDAPARAVVRAGVGATDIEWLRGAAWALQQALGLVWYYQESNPPMSVLGASTIARLLADDELRALG
jgi:aminoglycoside phosphotransferase (APT) family kinase protein